MFVKQEQLAPDALQMSSNSQDIVKYMRILDTYNKLGLGKYIDLPRIVLAGPKQCGKSSIIENLTGYPVQYASELKTQFPIEFTLIDDPEMTRIKAAIILDPMCVDLSMEFLERVRGFNISHGRLPRMTGGEFKRLLTEASNVLTMSLIRSQSCMKHDQILESIETPAYRFSGHTLRLVMRGPRGLNFSFIDTPGVSPDCPEDSLSDFDGALQVVLPLIKQSKTIIAAAFEADTTRSPEKLFGWIRSADPQGSRTIGIMTKFDQLTPYPYGKYRKVEQHLSLPAEKIINYLTPAYGSYGVRNKTHWEKTLYTSLEGVREREAVLFRTNDWLFNALDLPIKLGIHQLALGLDKLFSSHVRTQYASVAAEIRSSLVYRREQLNLLGPVNKSITEQREYLRPIIVDYNFAMIQCLQGDDSTTTSNRADVLPGKRIALQKIAFQNLLSEKEAHLAFHSATEESEFVSCRATSPVMTIWNQNSDIYSWINQKYQDMKASTIPGVVPHSLVESLFQEQTAKWDIITEEFIDATGKILLETAQKCLEDMCYNKTVVARLTELALHRTTMKIDLWRKSCHSILQNGRENLELLSQESEFTEEVNKARALRFLDAVASLKLVEEASDVWVAPVFGPLLSMKKQAPPKSKSGSESSFSSFSGSSSPKTPQSVRSCDTFEWSPPNNSGGKKEVYTEWKMFNPGENTRTHDSPTFRMRRFQARRLQASPSTSPPGKEYIRRAQDIITSDRQVVYQIHDILKAYYNISLRNYISSIFKTLEPDFREVIGTFSDLVGTLSDEEVRKLFEESDVDKRSRKALEEDVQRLQLAILEAEVILTEPTSIRPPANRPWRKVQH